MDRLEWRELARYLSGKLRVLANDCGPHPNSKTWDVLREALAVYEQTEKQHKQADKDWK
jgi:hypothetical protein